MPQLRQPGCNCDNAADLSTGESGGEGGPFVYTYYFRPDNQAIVRPCTLDFTFDAVVLKDGVVVTINSVSYFAPGCMTGTDGTSVTIPTTVGGNPVTTVDVTVSPHCDVLEEGETIWSFTIDAYETPCE
jgi:hypothetical protein